ARLAPESLDANGVLRELRRQHLQRDMAPERRIERAVDLAHATLAKQGNHFIVIDTGAGVEGHGMRDSSSLTGRAAAAFQTDRTDSIPRPAGHFARELSSCR